MNVYETVERAKLGRLQRLDEETFGFMQEQFMGWSGDARLSKIDVFRHNYDVWMLALKPFCVLTNKRFYAVIGSFMAQKGYGEMSESQVGNLLNQVKGEREATGKRGKGKGGRND